MTDTTTAVRPATTSHDPPATRSGRRPHVVVIGGGFGGLAAVRKLRKSPVDVTLIDRRNFHLFQPLLYQVATGELSPANIAAPLRVVLRRQKNVTIVLGEVTEVDLQQQRILTTDGEKSFDYLIVAAGSQHHYFGKEEWAPLAPGLKTLENATEIRRQILGAFEAAERCHDPAEVAEILTFVIVGAGPTGCEMAGSLSEIARHTLRNDFRCIDPAQSRIILVNSDEHPLEVYPEPLPQRALADLKDLGVEVVQHSKVTNVTAEDVTVTSNLDDSESKIRTRTVIWAAGVRASGLAPKLCEAAGIESGRGGRVPVQHDCSIADHPNVFAIGDLTIFEDPDAGELPGLAPVAMQMGKHVAKAIDGDLQSKPRQTFHYSDRGSMAVIGRFSAVGEIKGWKVKGVVAWALWLGVHLMFIALFRNRMIILFQWGWTFLTHDRSARLIVDGPQSEISTMETSTGWDEDPALPTASTSQQAVPQPSS